MTRTSEGLALAENGQRGSLTLDFEPWLFDFELSN